MKKNSLKSKTDLQITAKIMRRIEKLVCSYEEYLPNGWRCIIEFQREGEKEPYYQLDIEGNKGGGSYAPVKMQMLKAIPELSHTGIVTLGQMRDVVEHLSREHNSSCGARLLERLVYLHDVSELTDEDWAQLQNFCLTRRYGGIRIPYDILVTELNEKGEQDVRQTKGEMRIAFDGAIEWQNVFFCFQIFRRIQGVLNHYWDKDQIWYNLRGFKEDPCIQFWVDTVGMQEAPEDDVK